MDSRPFRVSPRTPRDDDSERTEVTSAAPRPQLAPSRPVEPSISPQSSPPTRPHKAPTKRKWLQAAIIIVVLVIIIVAFLWMGAHRGSSDVGIDNGKYQAVFTADGQVYFGKLHAQGNGFLKLTDAYYLENSKSSKDSSTQTGASSNLQLTKLHSKIYGPGDEVILQKDQLLYFENLRSDGQVAQLIKKDTGSN